MKLHEIDYVDMEVRALSKVVNFAQVYGSSIPSLQECPLCGAPYVSLQVHCKHSDDLNHLILLIHGS